jgi:hypothetical protein
MNCRLAAIAFCIAAMLGSPVWAAPLVEVQKPSVLVNCGNGYRAVGTYTPVQPGCMVMASEEDGHGYILYSDCDQEVVPGRVYTVKDDPGPTDEKAFRPTCKVAAAGWWPYGLYAAGAVVAICAAADCFKDEDHRRKPASP